MQTHSKKAERLKNVRTSGIRRLFALTKDAPDAISLGIGEPDFAPPEHAIEAAKHAMIDGKTHYTPSRGILELREALGKKFAKEYGLSYSPDNEILVTIGATEAVSLALLAFVNPGDEVLIPDPGFVCYAPAVLIAGGVPVSMPMLESDGFKPNIETVTSLVTSKSRLMIVNSPNNPTGSVLSHGELTQLSKLAVENDLIVVSDEVYEKIVYDDARHHCLATFPDMRDRTIVVNSFSKSYAMTGFRIGYALGGADLISAMLLVQQFFVASVNGPAQYAATAALTGKQGFVSKMVSEFDRRRRLIHRRLGEIEGFSCSLPKGAFYAFPSIRAFRATSTAFSEFLFDEARVVTTPGVAFGRLGEGYLRLSYATSFEHIAEAMERLEKAVKKHLRTHQLP